jgi:predicted enzyme related to lactoylglutathione lyase
MTDRRQVNGSITFFYYKDIEVAAKFYEVVMGFDIIDDQGWAKIFQINTSAYMGVVDGEQGFYRVQDKNAVLLTLVVNDVWEWYEYLRGCGVKLLTEVQEKEDIQVRCFFLEDPGGYALEIQQFLKPELARTLKTR